MYNLVLYIYAFGVWVASFFNKKVRKMVVGQRKTFDILRRNIGKTDRVVWFHAASLGEFEQGRPLMERLRRERPEFKILLTFFSPSGYEVRKNYDGADVVCYLPLDTPCRAHYFLKLARPEIGIFIKYEFWQNYLTKAHRRGVRLYSVSSIFRPQQHFFKWWGNSKPLRQFDHLFVQNQVSADLLRSRGIDCVTVVGDTRFDRVLDIRHAAQDLPLVQEFQHGRHVFIAGSSWEPDEEIYIPYFAQHRDWKLIIAPHKIGETRLKNLEKQLDDNGFSHIRYTAAGVSRSASLSLGGEADVLIVDCFGKLSSIYRYGDVALVGGGFGVGIHNVPEAAVYGVPVLFGPNNDKFREAQALLACGGAFEFVDSESFAAQMNRFISDADYLHAAGEKAGKYISSNAGASDICYRHIFSNLP